MIVHVAALRVDENVPLVPADFEALGTKLAFGNLREILDFPRELAVHVRRLRSCFEER